MQSFPVETKVKENGILQTQILPQADPQILPQAQVVNMFSVSEMYDLCTVKDKIGVIGIHTPTMDLICRSWKGLLDNHKYIKLRTCSVRIACASHQALDPLQVGTDPNTQISPQDLMNPILYRACTNDSWNAIMNKVYATGGYTKNSIRYYPEAFSMEGSAQHQAYYALLASNEWKKAMPQVGLTMTGLRPFVYTLVSTYGNKGTESPGSTMANIDSVPISPANGGGPTSATSANSPTTFKGPAMPYPAIPCNSSVTVNLPDLPLPYLNPGNIEKSFVACILMPPSTTQIMYYRLVVTWTFDFIKPVPLYEKYTLNDVASQGPSVYTRGYDIVQSSKEAIDGDIVEGGMLDTIDAPMELVLQK